MVARTTEVEKLLTPAEVASLFRVDPKTVTRWAKAGKLTSIRTLGGHRLNMGDGYALHGTDEPLSIGKAVSHGCVRLRNEDIAYLYSVVPVGTAVFIY